MLNMNKSKIFFAVALLFMVNPLLAEEGTSLDQTSDLIQQADNMNETDLSQVHVDDGTSQQATQLSEQEREVYQHAQDQLEQEQTYLEAHTKHQDTVADATPTPPPTAKTPDGKQELNEADAEMEKYRLQAQDSGRLTMEN